MTLPEWSAAFFDLEQVAGLPIPGDVREWAWGGVSGAGVRVAVVDSGVDADHPAVGHVEDYVAFEPDPDDPSGVRQVIGRHEDLMGHGTACAGIIRELAPDVSLISVRVLGTNARGRGSLLVAGIRWAVAQGMHVVNLSLSSRSERYFAALHDVADAAYFGGTVLVSAANNAPGPTYPSQYSSVVSVAARSGGDRWDLAYNARPPVEFAARGVDVEVAWSGGGRIVATGNSFAAPHVTAMVALMRSRHPTLTPFQVKAVLHAAAVNATEPA